MRSLILSLATASLAATPALADNASAPFGTRVTNMYPGCCSVNQQPVTYYWTNRLSDANYRKMVQSYKADVPLCEKNVSALGKPMDAEHSKPFLDCIRTMLAMRGLSFVTARIDG